jgi:hypothetical protein
MTAPNEQAAAAALQCGQCADNALPPRLIQFWPFGTPQQFHSCVTIRLTAEARPLLLRIRNDLLAALRGARSQEPWARGLKPARLIAMLRQLSFVMLGPLWEDAYRFPQTCRGIDPDYGRCRMIGHPGHCHPRSRHRLCWHPRPSSPRKAEPGWRVSPGTRVCCSKEKVRTSRLRR